MPEHGRPLFRSVFVKFVAIMLAMAFTLLLLVTGFFALIIYPNLSFASGRLIREYSRALAASSPDLEAARRACRHLDLAVRYEGPKGVWSTAADLPSIGDVRSGKARESPVGHEYLLEPAADGGVYLLAWSFGQHTRSAHIKLLWLLLFLMAGVVVAAYAFQRRLLRPVRWLDQGVARLSAGSLDVSVPVVARDEFGALTDAFNRMAERVKQMVQARDQLLLDVSHELRSPLTRLKVALEFLPEGEQRACMAADVDEMERMVSELLELERLRDGRGICTSHQDLLPILREAVESFGDQRPGVRLFAAGPAIVLDVDAAKIRRVLRNVLENALKYSLPDSRAVEISTSENDRKVVIRISDDGPGIPAADAENIFEPFYRVDRSRSKQTGGYGLGLSISKRIMEAHGGSITVEPNPGRGVSFLLNFRK